MKGEFPYKLIANPHVEEPIEQIWDYIDSFSGEFFEDEEENHERIDFYVPIPPMQYNGKFVKGICFSQGLEYLLKLYPDLKKIFHVGAYTMCSNNSWCDKADLYFNCYDNKKEEEHHKNKHKNKRDIIFLPVTDVDFLDEYIIAPTFNTKKTIDVLMVATPYEVKNHIMLAKAIKAYEEKYKYRLKVTCILGLREVKKDSKGNYDFSALHKKSQEILNTVNEILDNDFSKYIDIIPYVEYRKIPKYYTSAKCVILTSLVEGKNRAISEAMSCNTPIVVCKYFNQYKRGDHPIFYENSGELAEDFTPEAYADAIHKILTHPENYEPRKNYLKYFGKINFVNTCAQRIPYYRENIPDFVDGHFHDNIWVNLAVQKDYGLSYNDFLYEKAQHLCWVQGITRIDFLIKYYYSMFGINTKRLVEDL